MGWGTAPTQTLRLTSLTNVPIYPPLRCTPGAGSPCGGQAREGPGIQVWGRGSWSGGKGHPEVGVLGEGTPVCVPRDSGRAWGWRGTWAEVAGMGIQRLENPDGCMCVGEVGGAPGSGPCHAVCPFHPDPR